MKYRIVKDVTRAIIKFFNMWEEKYKITPHAISLILKCKEAEDKYWEEGKSFPKCYSDLDKIYFVEKYDIDKKIMSELKTSAQIYRWQELGAYKTEDLAKEFLKNIKENKENKQEVVYEDEF